MVDSKQAIASSNSDVSFVLDFLQRRKLEACKAKQLCLETARSIILERRPLPVVSKAMDVLISSFSHSFKTSSYFKGTKTEKAQPSIGVQSSSPDSVAKSNSIRELAARKSPEPGSPSGHDSESFRQLTLSDNDSDDKGVVDSGKTTCDNGSVKVLLDAERLRSGSLGLAESPRRGEYLNTAIPQPQEPQLSSPAISPDEMFTFAFAPVEEEMAGDPSYLVAVIIEFLLSASVERIKVHSNIHVLTVQLLARNERFSELGLFVINKIIEPSKELAF
ncbi:hypothetical protein MLD38_026023 [Melastoma candidum]|uniref:Uncharacterized protein n=1 Tax=Melastoma candidum TaxID=119954 RepID=A0ACB9NYN1_9MYRT|nr:hypothetical protein MLD38_026023 [Melastoma candidum]